jgi:hypothetical protein
MTGSNRSLGFHTPSGHADGLICPGCGAGVEDVNEDGVCAECGREHGSALEAAVDMREALSALLKWADDMGRWEAPCWDEARRVLARAKGATTATPPWNEDPYETAARAAGWVREGDCGGVIYRSDDYDSWKAAVSWAPEHGSVYGSWRECCESEGIDIEQRV